MKVFKVGKRETPGIILIYLNKSVGKDEHSILSTLPKDSDVAFVFSRSLSKKISPKKFSHLYGAVYYGVSEDDDEALGVWKLLDYLHEVEEKYFSYTVILLSDLKGINFSLRNLKILQNSTVNASVFSKDFPSKEQLEEIYTLPDKKGFSWFRKKEDDSRGIHVRYITTDHSLFIRPFSIYQFKMIDGWEDIVETFRGFGVKVMLPSILPTETTLNMKIEDYGTTTDRKKPGLPDES